MSRSECLDDTQMMLTTSHLDNIIQHYIFPIQFILGVVGNSMNLLVLLSKGMRSETNYLLSAMAFADLSLLFCMLPHSIASFEIAYRSYSFRYIYYISKRQINAMANLFSAAAAWLVLAVSIERFIGIRSPMQARLQWRDGKIKILIISIFVGAFIVTFYHHIAYKYSIHILCNDTQLRGNVIPIEYNWTGDKFFGKFVTNYVKFSKYLQLFTVILVPIMAVAFLNVSLICFVKNRDIHHHNYSNKWSKWSLADTGMVQRQERRVTTTVLAIVTCFTITHAPSLIPFVWETLGISISNPRPFLATVSIVNSLVITGKVLNFVLFCSSSVYFRRRLNAILLSRIVSFS
ncbi:unnamed protein product [Dracunculus medinensis]|uniref:G_PROTEIN_RECEP_F1_2 domain-containing protein n=1 Tax=Dracunculus medinensis TaxID=318479 RepID=A0A158Q389_DRAME|nr:unnamed protein product [Dracunculus medinensis]